MKENEGGVPAILLLLLEHFPGTSSVCVSMCCAGLCCIWVLPPPLSLSLCSVVHGRRVERNFLLPFFPLANGGARASGPEGGRWVGFRRE